MTRDADRMRWEVRILDDMADPFVDEATAFFNSQFGKDDGHEASAAMFRWKLGPENPAGPGLIASAMHAGTVVGMVTSTLKRGRLGGAPVTIAEMGDVYTRPGYRKDGRAMLPYRGTSGDEAYANKSIFGRLALELTDLLHERGIDIIFGTPNEQAMTGWVKRIGYVETTNLGVRSWHRPAAGALPLPRPVAGAASAALGLVARPVRPLWLRGVEVGPLDLDVDDVDALWERSAPGAGVELVQDARYFRHRFVAHPDATYELHAVRRRGQLVGVLAGRALTRPSGNSTYCIADWLLDDAASHLLPAAIAAIAARRSRSVDTISLWTDGTSLSDRTLRRLGFVRPRRIPVVLAPSERGRALASGPVEWDMRTAWSDNV